MILCTYGDCLRVPASEQPVAAEGQGARRRRAHGLFAGRRAEDRARATRQREVVFFAIGFETTTPPTALVIKQAARLGLANFSVLCNHVLTPAAITHILESPEVRELGTLPLDGFIGPAHVSTVIGSQPYEFFAEEYRKPVVIAGFEPLDVMQAILMLVRQVNEGRAEVENEFTRAVTRDGNLKAQALVSEVFELRAQLRMARPGRGALQRAAHPRGLRRLRRRAPLRAGHRSVRRQQGLRVRCHPARREASARLQGLRHGVHAGEPDRLVHGVVRRRLRGATTATGASRTFRSPFGRRRARPPDDRAAGCGGSASQAAAARTRVARPRLPRVVIHQSCQRLVRQNRLGVGHRGLVLSAPRLGELEESLQ